MSINKRIIGIIGIIFFYCFLFQNVLQQNVWFLKYIDEIYALMFFPLLLINKRKNKFDKNDRKILYIMLLLNVIGIISTLINQYQSFSVSIQDMLLVNKFMLSIFTTKLLFYSIFDEKYENRLLRHVKLMLIFFFVLMIMDYALNIFDTTANFARYGIRSIQLFYNHPTILSASVAYLLALFVLMADSKELRKVKNFKFILMSIILLLSTLRSKAFGYALIVILLYYITIFRNKKISLKSILVIGMVSIWLVFDQISFYFIDNSENSARAMLLVKSFTIATDFFPIGTGFATYGSYFSGLYYSKVYNEYGLSGIIGLSRSDSSYISDAFWPMIIGQFGYLGLILFVMFIIAIFKKIQKIEVSQGCYLAGILILSYLLVSSTAEAAFVHTIAIPLAFALGLVFIKDEKFSKTEKENKDNEGENKNVLSLL